MAPFRTLMVPRCVSDALYPSPVTIVTVSPCVGTCPANDTSRGCGGPNGGALAYGDVDPAMLARRVLVATDRIGSEHLAVDRPCPCPGEAG